MEHLDFVLWMVLFPITMAVNDFISAKTSKIRGQNPREYDGQTERRASIFEICIWLIVGILIF